MKRVLLPAILLVVGMMMYGQACAQGTAYFWAGGHFENEIWHDTVTVTPGGWVDIPIYYMGDQDVTIETIYYFLGVKMVYLDQFDYLKCQVFYPVTEWSTREFRNYNDDTHPTFPNPVGYHSLSFIGMARSLQAEAPLLHYEIPTKIMSFKIHAIDDSNLIGNTFCDAMISGVDPVVGPWHNAVDSTGAIQYPLDESFACVRFIEGYAYLPGDVNMYGGAWPAEATGLDVTYLVNYFRDAPISVSCLLDGFWASADINGDCDVTGNDVTKLVNFFRDTGSISYCPDYPPAWQTRLDLPESPPAGWPNCD